LATDFAKSKLKKLKWYVRYYNWLNRTFTTQVLFKNNRQELETLRQGFAEGNTTVPTELERIMMIES